MVHVLKRNTLFIIHLALAARYLELERGPKAYEHNLNQELFCRGSAGRQREAEDQAITHFQMVLDGFWEQG